MAEQVKVYINVNDVIPSNGQLEGTTDLDVDIVTTGGSERAVIKDVVFTVEGNGKSRCTPTLDLDGFVTNTGTPADLSIEGNLIVGPSSTLKVKANTTVSSSWNGEFVGMAFFEGSSGMNYLTGPGIGSPTNMTTKVRVVSSNHACDDAVAAVPPVGSPGGGDGITPYFYKCYNNQINKYDSAGTEVASSISHGSTGYSVTTDGEFLYRAGSQSNSTIWATKLSDHSQLVINTASAYQGPQNNQGSYFLYHDGYFYSKREGGYSDIWIISKDGTSVVNTPSNSDFNVGSYSDGACVVTPATGPKAGRALIIEQGTSYWSYYDIIANTVTRMSGGTSGSTEYAQGGAEIAPGVALIFTEWNDQAVKIDMNPSTPTRSQFNPYPDLIQHNPAFGNRFGFAGYIKPQEHFTYNLLATGIEIT